MRIGLALALAVICPATGFAQVELPFQPKRELREQGGGETDRPADARQVAQAEPILRVQFDEAKAIPGQPLDLRLTVLVPTFMLDPPAWPSLEAPNLLVRLPEGSTTPVSERIEGGTWPGVSRRYRLSPMVPGDFAIPPQSLVVTYADPETNEPTQRTLATETISFAGILPEGAEGLDPFLAADAVELSQAVAGNPAAMVPGDSLTRTVTARITATSPMFLPDLLPTTRIEGLAAYPGEPIIEENWERGVLSGTRTESVTYVAEGGGRGEMPALSLAWYNLGRGEVETASVGGFAVAVDGPPARSAAPRDWHLIGIAATLALLILLTVPVWLVRRVTPSLRRWIERRREAHLASEGHAFAVLQRIVSDRDLPHLHRTLDDWARKVEGPDPRRHPELSQAITDLGAARYGRVRGSEASAWHELASTLPKARRSSAGTGGIREALPPLNPGAQRAAPNMRMRS